MAAKVNADSCTGCGTCVDECPATAISIVDDLAVVEADDCLDCGVCEDACPTGAITLE
ncbi:MAG: 4Fe-4S binding protein [Methanosarcinaceae archaeon]|nr:4Fe-4S binding protein [Methanosarcinaceae archaeon]